jgi:fumarylacetoacetase
MDVTTPLQSFIDYAPDCHFSIYNLPYGVFVHPLEGTPRIGTAIGDYVLDLSMLESLGLLPEESKGSFLNQDVLNTFASKGPKVWSNTRKHLQKLLSLDEKLLQDNPKAMNHALFSKEKITMLSPFKIGGFTDFYASEYHASNVGRLFRGNESPLLPNWKFLPVGYNGRASTVFPSKTPIIRPQGQIKPIDADTPIFSPTLKLDFELEMGIFIGVGNLDGKPITVQEAQHHIFGLVLLNDWSARDIQAFEYQPLGPFLSKSFATSISTWVVPMEALKQVAIAEQNPVPVSYLTQQNRQQPNIQLSIEIQPRGSNIRTKICETNSKELYWTMAQMLAHHTVNHCIMKPGDLLGTGTISGPEKENWGSLLEITANGKAPIQLEGGETRTFLEDGDTVIMTGFCQGEHYPIGFGSLEGTICKG